MSFSAVLLGFIVVLVAVTLLLSAKFTFYRTPYASGRSSDKSCVLSKSPNRIQLSDVVELAAAVVWKQLFGVDTKNYLRGCYVASQKCFKLPPLTFQGLLDVELQDALVFRRAVYGEGASAAVVEKSDDVSPLFLVALTGPTIVLLLADAATSIRPLGALNTRNVFKVINPTFCRSLPRILDSSQKQELSYKAVFGGDTAPAYRRKSGVEFSITITVFHQYIPVLEQTLFFFQRLPRSFEPRFEVTSSDDSTARRALPHTQSSASVSIDQRDPRLWAASCKDYNPIHIFPLAAPVFGLKTSIAHGNHVTARIVEQLRAASPAAGAAGILQNYVWQADRPYLIETRFLRPMFLPANLDVWWEISQSQRRSDGERVDFWVGKANTVNMTGSLYEVRP